MIERVPVKGALLDLGASVNIMSTAIYDQKSWRPLLSSMDLEVQLADSTRRQPKGLLHFVPIKIRNQEVHADFIVLDMDDNFEAPLILGRPFLKIVKARIDTWKETIILNINRRHMRFRFQPREKYPSAYLELQETSINIGEENLSRSSRIPSHWMFHLRPSHPDGFVRTWIQCQYHAQDNDGKNQSPDSLSYTSTTSVGRFYHQKS
jgi:hypothetical protein